MYFNSTRFKLMRTAYAAALLAAASPAAAENTLEGISSAYRDTLSGFTIIATIVFVALAVIGARSYFRGAAAAKEAAEIESDLLNQVHAEEEARLRDHLDTRTPGRRQLP